VHNKRIIKGFLRIHICVRLISIGLRWTCIRKRSEIYLLQESTGNDEKIFYTSNETLRKTSMNRLLSFVFYKLWWVYRSISACVCISRKWSYLRFTKKYTPGVWWKSYGTLCMDGRCTLSFPDRVTNRRLFRGAVERERNRLAKEKSHRRPDSRHLNPAVGRLFSHCWTVSPGNCTVGRLASLKGWK